MAGIDMKIDGIALKAGTGITPFTQQSPEYYQELSRMRKNLESSLEKLPPELFKRKKNKTRERAKGFGITVIEEESKHPWNL